MEKKLVKITISGARAEFSVETRDQRGRLIKYDPGMDGLRTKTVDQALARVIDMFGNDPNYTIEVNGISVNTLLPKGSSESLGNRFLRWLDQEDPAISKIKQELEESLNKYLLEKRTQLKMPAGSTVKTEMPNDERPRGRLYPPGRRIRRLG